MMYSWTKLYNNYTYYTFTPTSIIIWCATTPLYFLFHTLIVTDLHPFPFAFPYREERVPLVGGTYSSRGMNGTT